MPTKFDYFLAFFRRKIFDGEKQVDLARSPLINRSTAYINKLYRGKPKSCPIEFQRSVATYYEISYDEMMRQGKLEYENKNPLIKFDDTVDISENGENGVRGNEITNPEQQKSILIRVAEGISLNLQSLQENQEKIKQNEELLDKIDLFNQIFNHLHEGVTFFNAKRDFVFSSNRWHFLDGVDLTLNPSIEEIVINIRKKIKNLDEVLDVIMHVASNPQKEKEIDVNFYSGHVFNFRIVPLFKDKNFKGTLLINTLKFAPQKDLKE